MSRPPGAASGIATRAVSLGRRFGLRRQEECKRGSRRRRRVVEGGRVMLRVPCLRAARSHGRAVQTTRAAREDPMRPRTPALNAPHTPQARNQRRRRRMPKSGRRKPRVLWPQWIWRIWGGGSCRELARIRIETSQALDTMTKDVSSPLKQCRKQPAQLRAQVKESHGHTKRVGLQVVAAGNMGGTWPPLGPRDRE